MEHTNRQNVNNGAFAGVQRSTVSWTRGTKDGFDSRPRSQGLSTVNLFACSFRLMGQKDCAADVKRACSRKSEIGRKGKLADAIGVVSARSGKGSRRYLLYKYKKIAKPTSRTVMIQRTISLLRFFSSAIKGVQHT